MVTTTNPVACMGGFCHLRDSCAVHYAQPGAVEDIKERICRPGQERPVPINFRKVPHGDATKTA